VRVLVTLCYRWATAEQGARVAAFLATMQADESRPLPTGKVSDKYNLRYLKVGYFVAVLLYDDGKFFYDCEEIEW
jgi:hypothetical protein